MFACHKRTLLRHKLIKLPIKTITCLERSLWIPVIADDSTYVTATMLSPAKSIIMQTITAQCTRVPPYSHYRLNHITNAFSICM